MTITEGQFQYMIEGMTSDIIRLVMENEQLTMAEAFDKVYNSHTYENLLNPKSQLYYQSPGYVYLVYAQKYKQLNERNFRQELHCNILFFNQSEVLKV